MNLQRDSPEAVKPETLPRKLQGLHLCEISSFWEEISGEIQAFLMCNWQLVVIDYGRYLRNFNPPIMVSADSVCLDPRRKNINQCESYPRWYVESHGHRQIWSCVHTRVHDLCPTLWTYSKARGPQKMPNPALPKDIENEHVRIKDILYLKFMFYHIAIPSLHYIFWIACEGYKTNRSKKLQRRRIYSS